MIQADPDTVSGGFPGSDPALRSQEMTVGSFKGPVCRTETRKTQS